MRTLLLVLLGLATSLCAWPGTVEDREIQYLISSVQSLQGAQFLRNGSSYDGANAADHLRLKLKNAGSRVKSAEDFIRLCASTSSMSGKPYEIRFGDGHTETTEDFLKSQLREFRTQRGLGGP